jgi:hypothetical protein
MEAFYSKLFTQGSWQHRLPEYIVVGRGYSRRAPGPVMAAGWWDSSWHFHDSAYLSC